MENEKLVHIIKTNEIRIVSGEGERDGSYGHY
jgi:hypothetical protein